MRGYQAERESFNGAEGEIMWQVRRILVVMGSSKSDSARRDSHQRALNTLQQLSTTEPWEVVFLDLTPNGRYEFPSEIAKDGSYTGDSFSRFEAVELLRSIRIDLACSFVNCRADHEAFLQFTRDLKLQPLWTLGQFDRFNTSLPKVSGTVLAQKTILNRFLQVHIN